MRIEAFWAKGYRSLRDVRLDSLGPFNVFYGPNGSGKSNILAAIQALFRLVEVIAQGGADLLRPSARPASDSAALRVARAAILQGLIQRRDVDARSVDRTILLGAVVTGESVTDLAIGNLMPARVVVEVTLDWFHEPLLWLSRAEIDGRSAATVPETGSIPPTLALLHPLLAERLPAGLFAVVDAVRSLHREIDEVTERRESANVLLKDLREGRLASALFAAKNASVPALRKRFRTLQTMLEGEPIRRPPFDVLRDVDTKEVSIRERLSAAADEEREVPLDLAGLGVVQLYAILAKILFSGTSVVAVEEPEAHLHAPTSGLHLRRLLQRLVDERHIEQLLLATHSNLFDLDPAGYFDVRLDETGATVVERRPLRDLDRHFYEPGPTLHALEELLTIVPADKVMFRRRDGAPVTAREMVEMLRSADPLALDYLRTLHSAAVDVVGLRNRKGAPT
jgi:ABC-type cobalamin/Fe3+-siderophores transport system ATPase subunit